MANIKSEDVLSSAETCTSGVTSCDMTKVKVEMGRGLLSEEGTETDPERIKKIKPEKADALDVALSAERMSPHASGNQFADTSMLTKEEDLGFCIKEEEESLQVDFGSCVSREDANSLCGDKALKVEIIRRATDIGRIESTLEPAFSFSVDADLIIEREANNLRDASLASIRKSCFSCTECSASFETNQLLRHHAVTRTSGKLFSCALCAFKCKSKSNLCLHLTAHSRTYVCSMCNFRFKSKCNLKSHQSIVHSNEKRFCCKLCNAKFKTEKYLQLHAAVHSEERFACKVCAATFYRKSSLSQHLLRHANEKHFVCDSCAATFAQKSSLKQHQIVHSKEKPFACGSCAATSAYKCNLMKHEFTHAEEKDFACEKCAAVFVFEHTLKQHSLVHLHKKLFACKVCAAMFTRRASLKRHLYVHLDEKIFVCRFCAAAFAQSDSLEQHLLLHLDKKVIKCHYPCVGANPAQRLELKQNIKSL